MAWWSRGARGRHALGAAVTSIPSGPLVLPATLPAPAAPPPPADEPTLEELLAQYGHLLEPLMAEAVPTPVPAAAVALVPEHVPVQDVPAARPADAAAPVQVAAEPAQPVATAPPLPVATVPTPVEPDLDALAWLSEVLAQQEAPDLTPVVVPVQVPQPFVPAQATGHVQLGFRDGSTASLGEEQSRALQDLARSLTSSD